ncbi:MAG: hypothetical protein ABSH38_07330 [Verrucomicrobiota bacterium]
MSSRQGRENSRMVGGGDGSCCGTTSGGGTNGADCFVGKTENGAIQQNPKKLFTSGAFCVILVST